MNKYLLVDFKNNTILNLTKVDTDFEENEQQTSSTSCLNKADLLNTLLDTIKEEIELYQEEHQDYCRICSECGHLMDNGYVIESGLEYYCSDECLHKNISEEEYLKLYDNGNGDTYWTEWR